MNLAIHQPETLPWLGFFQKIMLSDLFIILDDVQFAKNNFQNRNRLATKGGSVYWCSIPIISANRMQGVIRDTKIDVGSRYINKMFRRVKEDYASAPHSEIALSLLSDSLFPIPRYIIEFNMAVIVKICDVLGVDRKIEFSSALPSGGSKNERILDLCVSNGATTYISGNGGRGYLNEQIFSESGISVLYSTPSVSQEFYGGRPIGLSIFDYIAWLGVDRVRDLLGMNEVFRLDK